MISLLMDIATAFGIFASIPALYRLVKNRKTLKDISLSASCFYICSSSVNIMVSFLVGAWFSLIINIWYILTHICAIYWINHIRRNIHEKKSI